MRHGLPPLSDDRPTVRHRPAQIAAWLAAGLISLGLVGVLAVLTVPSEAQAAKDTVDVLKVGGSELTIRINPGSAALSKKAKLAWVHRAAQMVTQYFGRFSVQKLDVDIVHRGRGGVGFGQHFGGERVIVRHGSGCDTSDLVDDWVLVHEMLHTAFPYLHKRHKWMREGLSTYLESVVRAEAGVIDDDAVWKRWIRQMPNGLPDRGDDGLDLDRSWGRTYWGGALFWMVADLRIREQTGGKKTLQDALQAILQKGGTSLRTWKTSKVVTIGDAATGTHVLRDLYKELAENPGTIDLDKTFARLGVDHRGGRVQYNDKAPLAWLRKDLYQPRHTLVAMPAR